MSCFAKNCENSRWIGSLSLTFHRFPKDRHRRTRWATNCKATVDELKDTSVLCSDHFEPHCFKVREGKNKMLTADATPTIFNTNLRKEDDNVSLDSLDYLNDAPMEVVHTEPHVNPVVATEPEPPPARLSATVECRLCLSVELRENCVDVFRPFLVQFIRRLTSVQLQSLANVTDQVCNKCERKILQAQKFAEMIIQSDKALKQRLTQPVETEQIYCEPFKQEPLEDASLRPPIETLLLSVKKEEMSTDEETLDQDEVDLTTNESPISPQPQKSLETIQPPCKSTNRLLVPLVGRKATSSTPQYVPKKQYLVRFTKFICDMCDWTLNNRKCLYQHMWRKHIKKNFKCFKCKIFCHNEFDLRRHKLVAHLDKKKKTVEKSKKPLVKEKNKYLIPLRITFEKFRCHFCEQEFKVYSSIKSHLLKHHLTFEQAVTCDKCGQVFNHPHFLKNHIRKNHKRKEQLCNLCGQQSKKFGYHMATVHCEQKIKCKLCPVYVKHLSSLKKHMQRVHAVDSKIRCDICRTVYKTLELLKVHVNSEHLKGFAPIAEDELGVGSSKKHLCVACNTKFLKIVGLQEHIRQHNGVFKCPGKDCDRVFETHSALALHRHQGHAMRELKCDSCDYVGFVFLSCLLLSFVLFLSVADLCRHHETHQTVRKDGSKVDYCDKRS